SGLNYNDTISLGFVDENAERNSVSWRREIGSFRGSNGLLPTLWGQNEVHTFNFDLANLPLPNASTPNFISTLNALRFLDIHVQDDTSVDYVKLTIETEDEPLESVPEPSSLLGILGLGMLGFGTLKRRQKC
ncbi:MAG: PEP-CTERM sorting domain-containing protein, partial [Cyanobacteriota bacterium]|nr:PEP-CTERM sorting domain-containing protein [Cyanobacteriota bacterium]